MLLPGSTTMWSLPSSTEEQLPTVQSIAPTSSGGWPSETPSSELAGGAAGSKICASGSGGASLPSSETPPEASPSTLLLSPLSSSAAAQPSTSNSILTASITAPSNFNSSDSIACRELSSWPLSRRRAWWALAISKAALAVISSSRSRRSSRLRSNSSVRLAMAVRTAEMQSNSEASPVPFGDPSALGACGVPDAFCNRCTNSISGKMTSFQPVACDNASLTSVSILPSSARSSQRIRRCPR
mmetsp:Transcript_39453/g.69958  ORF Transcript_39453/g.69958 Transcript_39453/m.69958 type:complete len:242 (-) Transcript_39453:851-1576(-)